MTSVFRQAIILGSVMLKLEGRVRETLALLVFISVMVAVIIAFGVASAFLDPVGREKLFPVMVWVSFMVNAAVCLGRSFEQEQEHRALDGVLLAGVSPASIFFAKWFVNSVLLAIAHFCGVLVLGVMLGVSVVPVAVEFSAVSALVLVSYSALATLAAAITAHARLRQALLPLILLPLLFPLFFCAVELTTGLILNGSLDLAGSWLWLLGGLTLIYLCAGVLLFESAVKE